MKTQRIFQVLATLVAGVLYVAFLNSYTPFDYIGQAQTAVGQFSNDNHTYGIARGIAASDVNIPALVSVVFLISLVAIWVVPGFLSKEGKMIRRILGLLLLVMAAGLVSVGCGAYPATKVVPVKANETAFLVPLVGDTTSQLKFQSVDFLRQNQIPVKQVEIPVKPHSTGRMPWVYDLIPTMQLIVVDRTPVTREWTSTADTGTSSSNQAFKVESNESIDFSVGGICSALVTEEDAAKFLYYFSGKSLPEVMDGNIRGFVQAELFNEFGDRTLEDGKSHKTEIFAKVSADAKAQFSGMGITITNRGVRKE